MLGSWRGSLKATAVGTISGAAFGLAAFFFVTSFQHPGMGHVLFLLVPVVAGFSIALVARDADQSAVAAGLFSVLITLVVLIAMGKEGMLCALMALPIIGVGLAIGLVIGVLALKLLRRFSANTTTMTGLLLLVGPGLIFTGTRIESPYLKHARTEVVETTVRVNDSPEKYGATFSRLIAFRSGSHS